jgi:hypothetical protein
MTEIVDRASMVTEAIDTQTPVKLRLRRKTRPAAGDAQYGRSSVSNGKRLHVDPDASTASWSRRAKDIYALLTDDFGPDLSEAQKQLIRRATMLSIVCERWESAAAAGRDFDHALYSQYADQLCRTLAVLGLKQHAAQGD